MDAEQPDDDDRPWEQPGAVRRDCEPHRGRALLALAQFPLCLYVVWHVLSCARMGFGPSLPIGSAVLAVIDLAVNLVGVGFGAWVYALTRRDLARMAAGELDPRGHRQTVLAQICAWLGIVMGFAQVVGCVVVPFWRAHPFG